MSAMRYAITIEIPTHDKNFRFTHKLKTNFLDYDQFVEEIKNMIESGEMRRMVESMTKHYGGEVKMRDDYSNSYFRFVGENK